MTEQEWRARVLAELAAVRTDVDWLKRIHEAEQRERQAAAQDARIKGMVTEAVRLLLAGLAGIFGGRLGQ